MTKKRISSVVGSIIVILVLIAAFFAVKSVLTDINRPDFGSRQVRNMEEIHEGDYLLDIHRSNTSWSVVKVVKEPYWWTKTYKNGTNSAGWRFDVLKLNDDGSSRYINGKLYYDTHFLTDNGVIAYPSGWWNPSNALLRLEESELTSAKIHEILQKVLYK